MCTENETPKIWNEFFVENKKYWIQNVENSHHDAIINAMGYNFASDEPLGMYLKQSSYPKLVQYYMIATKEVLQKGKAIVCLTMENDFPVIAGFFIFEEASAADDLKIFRPGRKLLMYFLNKKNICDKLNIDKYLGERGLYVFSKFRGKGIACQLLSTWELVCKAENLTVGFGIFSSICSQKAAERAGLIKVHYVTYRELRREFLKDIPHDIENHTEGVALYCTKHPLLSQ